MKLEMAQPVQPAAAVSLAGVPIRGVPVERPDDGGSAVSGMVAAYLRMRAI